MLKINVLLLLAIATAYLGVAFFSSNDGEMTTTVLPLCIVTIMVGTALLEVDRRLCKLESQSENQESSVGDKN